jgi:hypothetical protein
MADDFEGQKHGLTAPAPHLALVSPSDTVDLPFVARALVIGGTGTVKVTTVGGETLILPALPDGYRLDARITRVWLTDTTATDIVAMW